MDDYDVAVMVDASFGLSESQFGEFLVNDWFAFTDDEKIEAINTLIDSRL